MSTVPPPGQKWAPRSGLCGSVGGAGGAACPNGAVNKAAAINARSSRASWSSSYFDAPRRRARLCDDAHVTSPQLLRDLVRCSRPTNIVDVGASLIEGDPPYREMLNYGLCTVTGFEPLARPLTQLQTARGRWSATSRSLWAMAASID